MGRMPTETSVDASLSKLVGLELKGAIIAHGWNASDMARTIGRDQATFNRWLNGKVALPLNVLGEVVLQLGLRPGPIVDRAFVRMGPRVPGARTSDPDDYEHTIPVNA